VTACPLCQVNLECYQKQVNKEFGTEFNMPVMYFTQLMGLALGIPPKRLGIGSELVAVMPAIKEAQEAEPVLAAK
jgi:heterodisulfide reductase subunit B2